MSEHTPNPTPHADRRYHGLYLDAETTGLGAHHDRLTALALLPFTFDAEGRITPLLGEAFSCPDPQRPRSEAHRPTAAGDDARAPGIDLARAGALIERAHLIVTHTRGFSRALLEKLVPATRDVLWLDWQLGIPDLADGSTHLQAPQSRGLEECRFALWLLAQPDTGSGRSVLARLIDQSPEEVAATAPGPHRLQ